MSHIKHLIGLSLSFCVSDILQKKVEVSDISAIVTSTAFPDAQSALIHYYAGYWEEYATVEECRVLLDSIWHLVMQPRLSNPHGHRGHTVGHGWWLNTQTGKLSK